MGYKLFSEEAKNHVLAAVFLLAIAILLQRQFLSPASVPNSDVLNVDYTYTINMGRILKQYHQFPLWTDTYMGGMPFFVNSQYPVLYFTTLFQIFLPFSASAFLNFMTILNTFLSGLFMYLLMIYILKKESRYAAVVSGLIWMGTIPVVGWNKTWHFRANTIIWLPLILLMLMKAYYTKKNWIGYSMLAGLFMAFAFHGGGVDVFLFFSDVIILFGFVFIIGKNIKSHIIKMALIGTVMSLFFFGLIAVKLIPLLEFSDISSKSGDYTFEESVGKKITKVDAGQLLNRMFFHRGSESLKVGIAAVLLAAASFFLIRKRMVIFGILIAVSGLLIASGSPYYYLFWKFVPGFGKIHHVERAYYIFTFGIAILAGMGLTYITARFKRQKKIISVMAILALIIDIVAFGYYDYHDFINYEKEMETNPMWNRFANDKDIFRVHKVDQFMIGGKGANYGAKFGKGVLMGLITVWIPEYFNEYLGIANRDPAKFFGMLNTKYLYSENLVNISGLRLLDEMPDCLYSDCRESGPYLYLNEEWLPRAYLVDNSILILGQQIKPMVYTLMLKESFDPRTTVIIHGRDSINDYSFEELSQFSAIILTQNAITADSGLLLAAYVSQGGILLPNILNETFAMTDSDINSLLLSLQERKKALEASEVEFIEYSPSKYGLRINSNAKFLVLAEKFFMFEGWRATLGKNRLQQYRANGINTAIYLGNAQGRLGLSYLPTSFLKGLLITLFTAFLMLSYYLIYRIQNKR